MAEHDVYPLLDGRKRLQEQFTMLDNRIFQRSDLSMCEKMVYITLCRYANSHGTCFPKQQTIADCVGCSRKAVNQALKTLIDKKLVKVVERQRNRASNVYMVKDIDLEEENKQSRCNPESQQVLPTVTAGVTEGYSRCYPELQQVLPRVTQNSTSLTVPTEQDHLKAAGQENKLTPKKGIFEGATNKERECLQILKSIPGYPLDFLKDLKHLRNLAVDFPGIDILAELKKWRDWLLDHPLKRKRSNPRLGLRNWLGNAVKFNRRRGCSDSEKTDSDDVDPYEGVGV